MEHTLRVRKRSGNCGHGQNALIVFEEGVVFFKNDHWPGLTDRIFPYQKIPNLVYFEGLGMKKLGIFYVHFGILRPFCVFYHHLLYFVVAWFHIFLFWYVSPKKSGNPVIGCHSLTYICAEESEHVITKLQSTHSLIP
jgi:hypothetical protein